MSGNRILVLGVWLAFAIATKAFALSSVDFRGSRRRHATFQFAWFGGGGSENSGSSSSSYSSAGEDGFLVASGNKSLGGVAGTMMAMENFKASQRIGKTTEALVQDLAGTTVEGSSDNGKVKVVYDCRQQPIDASIDPAFFKEASASTVSAAFIEAMKDAHFKSRETMNDKMKGFYNELGLS